MEKERILKEDFKQVRLLDPYKQIFMVYLSPREIGDEIESVPFRITHEPRNYELRMRLAELQKEYDTSPAVNSFEYDGRSFWLDKATRVGLVNSLRVQKESGLERSTLWFGGIGHEVSIDDALSFLSRLELYAIECYNVTQRHLAEIKALETLEDILAYDFTEGYPPKIEANI